MRGLFARRTLLPSLFPPVSLRPLRLIVPSWRPWRLGGSVVSVAAAAGVEEAELLRGGAAIAGRGVDVAAQDAEEGEVAVEFAVVEAVADDEFVGDSEADVVDRDRDDALVG